MQGEVIVLGSGTSEGVPRLSCLVADPPSCKVCIDAMLPGSKNRRRNTSIVIRTYVKPFTTEIDKTILVDCGKFFWHSALETFPKYKITKLDAIIITHAHADAIGGLDDLRDLTRDGTPIPIFLRQGDFETIKAAYPYLVQPEKATGSGFVPTLSFHVFDESKPLVVAGVVFQPFSVLHGPDYYSLGFRFGNVVYISDVNSIPDDARLVIAKQPRKPLTKEPETATGNHVVSNQSTYVDSTDADCIELMIVDSLRPKVTHTSHFCLDDAIREALYFKAKKTLVTGMNHEFDHEESNGQLSKLLHDDADSIDIQLCYDGQLVQALTISS